MNGHSKYDNMKRTVQTFIEAYNFTPAQGKPDLELLTSLMGPNYSQSWGHNNMKRERPGLQKVLDRDGFLEHLKSMIPFLESCKTVIHDTIVDEQARTVVIRNSFFMCPKGQAEAEKEVPENDLVWIFRMDETGNHIESAMEFLDATATARIGDLIMKARQQG